MHIPYDLIMRGRDDDWPFEYDTPEEALLIHLYRGKRIDIDYIILGVEDGTLVMKGYRVEHDKPRLLK